MKVKAPLVLCTKRILYFIYIYILWGFFPAHTQLIVRFGKPSPHGFVLVPDCGNLGWTDLRAKGLPCSLLHRTLRVPHRLEKHPTHVL